MARRITKRYRVTGTLTAETPLHVGASVAAIETDLPVARNGAHQPVIPGTSLAGALRAWHHWACDTSWDGHATGSVPGGRNFTDQLWGFTPGRGRSSREGMASYVLIEDAPVTVPGALEIRDHVGIDRVEGRAADGIKYDRQILPKGSALGLDMTVEVPAPEAGGDGNALDQGVRAALAHLLTALEAGEVRLGAAKTRGLGRVKLQPGYVVKEQDLMTRGGMLALLKGEAAETLTTRRLLESVPDTLKPRARPRLDITIDWEPHGPVMVKSDAEGISVDMLPLVSGVAGEFALVIPGSSIKGALRSQAERIEATVCGIALTEGSARHQRFVTQIRRCPLAQTLFGAPPDENEKTDKRRPSPDDPPRPGLGALGVEDCFATPRFRRDDWQKVMSAGAGRGEEDKSQAEMLTALKGVGLTDAYPATHVAIDRWTGGAAEKFLYSVLEPHGVAWPAMHLSVDLGRLPDGDRLAALALLLLTLRDLVRQRIPIGFAGNRGMGTVKVRDITFAVSGMDEEQARDSGLAAFAGLTLNEKTWSARQDGLTSLQDAWAAYLENAA